MPVSHSRHNTSGAKSVCGCALLPVKTNFRGPAPSPSSVGLEKEAIDIVDEALRSFRWNILFKNFEVLGDADRVLVYLTLWIQKCLSVASQASGLEDASRQLEVMASADMPGPGDAGFVLAPLFPSAGALESQTAKAYLKQIRQESLYRLLPTLYPGGQPNKWWFQFSKKKFMNFVL
ncbi:unnamed protein product [Polarella glacialis]|uniref:Actin-related protein 2/3 complex subunit 3 n=1 Tax=Polarella glacialis TaxID=89957 RepID=A0A813G5U6_POLGL|nr:unnamed protein product [Polarella glacialis]CAE8738442.1 unnamed protein product [Polarella glacialis]|mmetsp:Transcript_30408/g.48734  ORF Transcript_30408/g.48734 Transcript_30408/m.48734 type:complete len:177 (+) Transcript_30408:57-587(+)